MFGRKNKEIKELKAIIEMKEQAIDFGDKIREFDQKSILRKTIKIEELEKENEELKEQLDAVSKSRKEWIEEATNNRDRVKVLEDTITCLRNDAAIDSRAQQRLISENMSLKAQSELFEHGYKTAVEDYQELVKRFRTTTGSLEEANLKLSEENAKLKSERQLLIQTNTILRHKLQQFCPIGAFNCRCGGLRDDTRG